MPGSRKAHLALALALHCIAGGAAQAATPLQSHLLDNGTLQARVSEAIGGRLLSFSLAGRPNFLRLEESAGDPDAAVDASTDNVGWLGHEVWAGPQKDWWGGQDANPARAAARAVWPPDPYLSLARYTLVRATGAELVLDSPASPVSGLQLRKRYALVQGKPNSLRLEVTATNRRDREVARDIWFNTRAHADTRVYVPVAAAADVTMQKDAGGPGGTALPHTLADGVFSLDMPAAGEKPRKGKVLLQPAAGWMAGFRGGQAFIVQFARRARGAIHPDQGQVELYHDVQPGEPEKGLLEMEVHAPYVRLAPGRRMEASELWTILPYDGPDTRAAHLAFLRARARALGLEGLDGPARAGAR
jgi:hypothetical protein